MSQQGDEEFVLAESAFKNDLDVFKLACSKNEQDVGDRIIDILYDGLIEEQRDTLIRGLQE